MRVPIGLLATLLLIGLTGNTVAAESDAITIKPADFSMSQEKILEAVANLEGMAVVSKSTAQYARGFRDLQDDLKKAKPPLVDWSQADRDRVQALPEPTDAAWQALKAEEARTQERIKQRGIEAEQAYEAQASERERARLEAERDRLAEEALNRPPSQTIIYNDPYPYYGGGWYYPYPSRPRPPKRGENRYYGTKPNIPNNYEGNPIRR